MKTPTTLLKISLVGLFLAISTIVFPQVAPPDPSTSIGSSADLNVGTYNGVLGETAVTPVIQIPNAVLFFPAGGPSITLAAEELEDANGLVFTSFLWQRIDYDGDIISGQETEVPASTNEYTVTGLDPGYHRFRVFGFVDDDGVKCQSDEFQEIIVFVLPPLDPTAGTLSEVVEFCLNDVPPTTLDLGVDVLFGDPVYNANGFPNPDVEDFALTYRWYAVNSNEPGTQIALTDPATATNAGAANAISLDYEDLTDIGTYTFHVEVQYSDDIKARDGRSHALWTTQVLDGEGNPFELVVTPVPGRPTITIEEVVD